LDADNQNGNHRVFKKKFIILYFYIINNKMNKTSTKIYLKGGSNKFLRKIFQDFTDKCITDVNSLSEFNNKLFDIKDSETGELKKNLNCNKTLNHWKKNMNENNHLIGEKYMIKKLEDKKKLLQLNERFTEEKEEHSNKIMNEKKYIKEQYDLINGLKEDLKHKEEKIKYKNDSISQKENELNRLTNELIEKKENTSKIWNEKFKQYENLNMNNEKKLKTKLEELEILNKKLNNEFQNKYQSLELKEKTFENVKDNLQKEKELEISNEKNRLLNEHKNKLYELDLIQVDLDNKVKMNKDLKKKYDLQHESFEKNYNLRFDELNNKIKEQENLKQSFNDMIQNANKKFYSQMGGKNNENIFNRMKKEKKIINYNKKIRNYLLKKNELHHLEKYVDTNVPVIIRNNINKKYSEVKILVLQYLTKI